MDLLEICANAAKHSLQVRRGQTTATGSLELIIAVDGVDKNVGAALKDAYNYWRLNLPKLEVMPDAEFKKASGLR
jgi:hypothetical protein